MILGCLPSRAVWNDVAHEMFDACRVENCGTERFHYLRRGENHTQGTL
jgi:hypothetical protein